MKMKVKNFTIEPLLCPLNMNDCSSCRHAGKFSVRNPPAMGTAPTDFGEHECNYFVWYQNEYNRKEKEIL